MKGFSKWFAIVLAALLFAVTGCTVSSGDGSSHDLATVTPVSTSVKKYSITIADGITNGTVTADKQTAAEGEKVTLSISPSGYYVLNTLNYTPQGESAEYLCGIGDTRTFVMPAKNVTICAEFKIPTRLAFTGTTYRFINKEAIGEKEFDIVEFGDYPQRLASGSVCVNEGMIAYVGSFTYYKGEDGYWYVKELVSDNVYKYFKVEPIKWRVLAKEVTSYYKGGTQVYDVRKLLLAENVLQFKRFDEKKSNYANSEIREWLNNEFLNTAFTSSFVDVIAESTVDDTEWTTYPDGMTLEQGKVFTGKGPFSYGGGQLQDKVFFLSVQDVTREKYGFPAYYYVNTGNSRIKSPSEFAIKGLHVDNTGADWWLRTHSHATSGKVRYVRTDGYAQCFADVNSNSHGVVPALRLDVDKLD